MRTAVVVLLGLVSAAVGALVGTGASMDNYLRYPPDCALPAGSSVLQEVTPTHARHQVFTSVTTVTMSAYSRYGSVLGGQDASVLERNDVLRCVFGTTTVKPTVVAQTAQTVTATVRTDYLSFQVVDGVSVSAEGARLTTDDWRWPRGTRLALRVDAKHHELSYSRPPDEWSAGVATWSWTAPGRDSHPPSRPAVTVHVRLGAGERLTAYLSSTGSRGLARVVGDYRVVVRDPLDAILGWSSVIAMAVTLLVILWRHRFRSVTMLALLLLPLLVVVDVARIRDDTVKIPVPAAVLLVVALVGILVLRRSRPRPGSTATFSPWLPLIWAPILTVGLAVWLGRSWAAVNAALAVLLVWVLSAMFVEFTRFSLGAVRLVPIAPRRWYPRAAEAVVAASACAVGYGLGSYLGTAFAAYRADPASRSSAAGGLAAEIAHIGIYLGPFLLLAVLTAKMAAAVTSRLTATRWIAADAVGGAALAWAAMSRSLDLSIVGMSLPVAAWALAAVIATVLARRIADVPGGPWLPAAPASSPPPELLRRGPYRAARTRARLGLTWAAALSAGPVAYLLWASLTALPDKAMAFEVSIVTAQVVGEVVRWLLTGWLYGLLLPVLPGRIGPLKALWLAAMWFATSLPVAVADMWTGNGAGREWLFPGLQLLLFLTVLAVVLDLVTVRVWAASGSRLADNWSALLKVYNVNNARQIILYAAPAVAAVVAIGQQLVSGTALDFVSSLLTGTPTLLGK